MWRCPEVLLTHECGSAKASVSLKRSVERIEGERYHGVWPMDFIKLYIFDWSGPDVHCRHQYQQLPLIPVSEFLRVQPEHSADDERSLMFARINHELVEREALEQQRQALLRTKQGLIADNKKRKDDLASLDKDLETFIDVSQAISRASDRGLLVFRPQDQFRRPLKSSIECQPGHSQKVLALCIRCLTPTTTGEGVYPT